MTVLSLQNIDVARQLACEREVSLRPAARGVTSDRHQVRRWIGHRLVRIGTRLASEQPLQRAPAR
jgi:hypothetical protein